VERRLKKSIESWLNAEGGGNAQRAEAALRAVFLRLPALTPPADFVDRVLVRLGIRPESLATHRGLTLQFKFVLGLCYVLAALAVIWLPGVLAELGSTFGSGLLISFLTGVLVSATKLLSQGVVVWETLTGLARAVSASLASPTVFAAMATTILVSAIALRLLHDLLVSDRNARDAQPG
jgi:hypothetical protein